MELRCSLHIVGYCVGVLLSRANNWWERSPNLSSSTNFFNVNNNGNPNNNNNASNNNGVVVGFSKTVVT